MKTSAYAVIIGIVVLTIVIWVGFGWLFEFRVQFRITNRSGTTVSVRSGHTGRTYEVANGTGAVIPHADGTVTIRQDNGKIWKYAIVRPMDLSGTRYEMKRNYPIPFGGGSFTANLLLTRDGLLYAAFPGTTDVDEVSRDQPAGFPIEPG